MAPLRIRIPWIVIAALSIIAAADSLWLHLAQTGEETFTRVCTVAPGFDCAPALSSHYSRIFSIPLSSYGLATYLLFALMATQSLFFPVRRDRNALILTVCSGAATFYTMWLAWISANRLRAYCPLCLVLHLITPLLFIASLVALTRRNESLRRIVIGEFATITESKLLIAGVLFVPLLLAVGLPLYHRRARDRELELYPEYRRVLEGTYQRVDDLSDRIRNNPSHGRPDAPVVLVEFADFSCPVCAESRYLLEDMLRIYDIRLVFVNHPRERACNPWAETDHPGACLAGLVAAYAHQRGNFWPVHDALFEQSDLLLEENRDVLARVAGAKSMREIMADSVAIEALARDVETGHAAGVKHTPSIFINGMGVEGMPERWFLEEAIENELAREPGGREERRGEQ